jgi:hypothetical protein
VIDPNGRRKPAVHFFGRAGGGGAHRETACVAEAPGAIVTGHRPGGHAMKARLLAPVAAVLLSLSLSTGCIFVTDGDSSLTVINDSSFILYEIHVADIRDPVYGPDLLRGDVLYPGESLTVILDCGTYDVLIVDEFNVECELLGLDLCFEDTAWVIDDVELALCSF